MRLPITASHALKHMAYGPGFAFFVVFPSLFLTTVLWALAFVAFRSFVRRRR